MNNKAVLFRTYSPKQGEYDVICYTALVVSS